MPRAARADVVPIRATTPALPDTAVPDGYHPAMPLADIDPNPQNVRRDLGDLTELIDSITAVGVRHPVTVTPIAHVGDDTTRWVLVDGHRRYAAAQQAGQTTIPAIIRTDIAGDVDVLTEMLRAGLLQQRLSPVEEASAYLQLEILGLSAGEIAKRVGRSRSTVEQRLHLMDLPEGLRDQLHERAITLDEAAAIGEFTSLVGTWSNAARWVKELQADAGGTNWRHTIARAREAWKAEQKRREARAVIERHRVQLVAEADVPQVWNKIVRTSWFPDLVDHPDDPDSVRQEALGVLHAACPGAAGSVSPGGYIRWLCLQPELHEAPSPNPVDEQLGGTPGTAVPYVEDDPWAASEQLAQAWREAVRNPQAVAAAEVRRTWIRDVLLPSRRVLTSAQAAAVARYTGLQLTRYLLDLDGDQWLVWASSATEDDVSELAEADIEEALEHRLRNGDPMRTLLAGLASQAESRTGDQLDRDWLALLQALGYEVCSWEEQAVAERTGICRVCLCTEDAACEDGLSSCWWVMPGVDLCSKCARAEVAAATADQDG